MIPKKPAPDLIRGGYRFSEKIMRNHKDNVRRPVSLSAPSATVRVTASQRQPFPSRSIA
jgi:hypothetical protein